MLNLVKDYDIKESDLNGALNGLRLLISTYKFNLTDFANGKISIPEAQRIDMDISEEYFEDTPLIVHDLHLLGQLAYNEKNLVQSIDILTAAEKLAKDRKDPLYKDIKYNLKTVIKKHDELRLRSQVDPKFILHHKPIGIQLKPKWRKFREINKNFSIHYRSRISQEEKIRQTTNKTSNAKIVQAKH